MSTVESEPLILLEEIKKYDTGALIEFLLKEENLRLDEEDLKIIRKEKIARRDFLTSTKEEFVGYGLKGGPAKRLSDYAKECKEQKRGHFHHTAA